MCENSKNLAGCMPVLLCAVNDGQNMTVKVEVDEVQQYDKSRTVVRERGDHPYALVLQRPGGAYATHMRAGEGRRERTSQTL